MFDDKPVHRAMERIFPPLETPAMARPAADRSRSIQASPPPRRRRWFMGKDGIAAAGFALAIMGLGLVVAPRLITPTAPPTVRMVATVPAPMPVSPQPAPIPAPVVIPKSTMTAAATAIAAPTIRPAGTARARPIRRRYARPRRYRSYRQRAAPRLGGAALRRALARDVVITRRLNQDALRRLPPAPR